MKRVEICGGIASGKTTLAKLIEQNNLGVAVYENFQANPFWKAFYENPGKFIFETEIAFTLQHYHEIKKAYETNNADRIICDNSFLLDLAYAKIGLTGNKLEIYSNLWQELINDIGTPDIVIVLKCGVDEELERIKRRNRDVEKNMSIDFLESLNNEVYGIAKGEINNVIELDSERLNFADSDNDKRYVLNILGCV